VLFLWDVWLIPAGANPIAMFSHDEFAHAWFQARPELERFTTRPRSFA
jgi:hypothetical protein